MNSEQGAAQVIEQLEALRVNYMLVGAFSSNIYGIPRSTKDADIVVAFDTIQIVEFCERLGQNFQLDSLLDNPASNELKIFLRAMVAPIGTMPPPSGSFRWMIRSKRRWNII